MYNLLMVVVCQNTKPNKHVLVDIKTSIIKILQRRLVKNDLMKSESALPLNILAKLINERVSIRKI